MGIRKNAKFLTAAEREAFVKACVLMQAEIVNPAAPAAQRYSRWDQHVAIYLMVQSAFAPGSAAVNFANGGLGAYGFLSWHRQFLRRFELELQAKVPGVTLPYWDWSDPASIMGDDFLGPNGNGAGVVTSGYFAETAPGSAGNPTPAPPWWPAGLTGWRLHAAFGGLSGPLRRSLGAASALPSAADVQQLLAMPDLPQLQNALETGTGLASGHGMSNAIHLWFGNGTSHMGQLSRAPFDPFFYLHHCNIDRLWAMWQADGHASDFPSAGGKPQHHRLDPMYPWVGGLAGYGTVAGIQSTIPMPDFSALGVVRPVDTLDHRNAQATTYDTLAIIGIGLDRTGSMLGLTPDPMTTGQPDVTKWEAARRGVSAFLQDCETVQASGAVYTVAGIETFRSLPQNDFQPLFAAPGYGLVKAGSGFSRAAFDASAGAMSPAGGTPLADALLDAKARLVDAPFGGQPADEGRFLAMLTDGILTSGAPLSSVANGSLAPTAVFAMGFGTGLDVDYATLQGLVDKGRGLPTQQVFHGETAGVIDKFYSSALASAIGFTSIFDPVLELFAGEHTQLGFDLTSADDSVLLTAQGMDFDDDAWRFALIAPDGCVLFGNLPGQAQRRCGASGRCPHPPRATVRQARGRLTVFLERDRADDACWVGRWQLAIAYRAVRLDALVSVPIDSLLAPSGAGTLRGPRYGRLLLPPRQRVAQRNVTHRAAHAFDTLAAGTNRSSQKACDVAVNVYARTRLRYDLVAERSAVRVGDAMTLRVQPTLLQGSAQTHRALARAVTPAFDLGALRATLNPRGISADALARGRQAPRFDSALALAAAERKQPRLAERHDRMLPVEVQKDGSLQVPLGRAELPGAHHVAVWIEGEYHPQPGAVGARAAPGERFTRLLTTMVAAGSGAHQG